MPLQQRHLAAILFTDIVGYTSIMQHDEQRAMTLLRRHKAILEKSVSDHEGDLIEYFGDGSLSIFTSVTEALLCAIQVQKQLQSEPAVPLRVGLHIGEILSEDNKVMGDGVNLASRIQALGQAGSILFSKEIYDKIRNHQEFKAVPLGRFALKNVEEPMEVFALANEGLTVPRNEEMIGRLKTVNSTDTLPSRKKWIILALFALLIAVAAIIYMSVNRTGFTGNEKSIAVLPFENIGNDTLQEYFSDGITEDIITQLSKIADLKVISRTSVMQYKNTSKNIKQIAEELDVAAILEGSVRKEGESVRINAQLIDANTDRHIWADQYNRNASEVFAIQSDVAQRIAKELNAKLTTDEGKRIEKKATENIEAYEEYLRARQSRLHPREAEELLLNALAMDSTFALAWARLAYTYSKMSARSPTDVPFYIRKSLDAALTAVNYGPELSETHMILGDILKTITLNPALSIKELNKSIALNPNNAEAYVFLAFALMELGRFSEAESNLIKAKQLDPLSGIMRAGWSSYYRYSRNPEKLFALTQDQAYQVRYGWENEMKNWYHFLKENYDSILLHGSQARNPVLLGIAYTRTGKTRDAKNLIDSLKSASEYDNAFSIGIIYGWLEEKQKAMEYLNLAYRLYDYDLISIKVNKIFDPLRNEEEFKELMRKMGM